MKLISHRGYINGPNKTEENSPEHILNAINNGYDVEIDVWFIDDKWYLGHDNPTYEIKYHFKQNIIFHKIRKKTKNIILEVVLKMH